MDPGLGYLAVYYPEVVDFSTFSVNDAEAAAATALLSRTNLPFRRSEVQLAFDNFQLSYEVRRGGLARHSPSNWSMMTISDDPFLVESAKRLAVVSKGTFLP
jgi:hypothetical protein